MAPLPDMRASRSVGAVRSTASARAISGTSAIAGASRSLRLARASAAKSPSLTAAGSEKRPASASNTCPVDTATPGLIRTAGIGGGGGTRGATPSPIPVIRTVSPARQTGTSAPRTNATPARADSSISTCHSRAHSRSAAAASAEPPPIPEATGRFFSRCSAASAGTPQCNARALAARRTRFSAAVPRAAAKGPETVRLSPSAGAMDNRSPTSAKATRLSSS